MEVFIETNAVLVELEIGINDLDGFKNLLPSELLSKMGVEAEPLAERLPRFFLEDLTIRLDDGPPLKGCWSKICPTPSNSTQAITATKNSTES